MGDPRYSLHALVDDATALAARVSVGRNRFFARDVEGAPVARVVENSTVDAPAPAGPGIYEATAATPAGTLDPAFRVWRWLGPDRPTLLYLQGSGERPFDASPRKNSFKAIVLDAPVDWATNLVVLRAPFHAGTQRDYARAMGRLTHFTSMLAAMVVLTERLVDALGTSGSPTLVTGISLGGWATNLHAACFGSARAYAPLLAGTALDDLFTRSTYRWLTGRRARERPERLREALNFERAFRSAPAERVFPLLGRHDRFIRHGPQVRSYGGVPVETMNRGHVTSLVAPAPIREHLRRFVGAAPPLESQGA